MGMTIDRRHTWKKKKLERQEGGGSWGYRCSPSYDPCEEGAITLSEHYLRIKTPANQVFEDSYEAQKQSGLFNFRKDSDEAPSSQGS